MNIDTDQQADLGTILLAEMVGYDGPNKVPNLAAVQCVLTACQKHQGSIINKALAARPNSGVRPYMGWAGNVLARLEGQKDATDVLADVCLGYGIYGEVLARSDLEKSDIEAIFLEALSGTGLPPNVAAVLADGAWIDPETWGSWLNRVFNPFSSGTWFDPPKMPKTPLAMQIGAALRKQIRLGLLAQADVTPEAKGEYTGGPDLRAPTLEEVGSYFNGHAIVGGPVNAELFADLPDLAVGESAIGGPVLDLIKRAAKRLKAFGKKHPVLARFARELVKHGISKIPILSGALAVKRGLIGGPQDYRDEKLIRTGLIHPAEYKPVLRRLIKLDNEHRYGFDYHPVIAQDL